MLFLATIDDNIIMIIILYFFFSPSFPCGSVPVETNLDILWFSHLVVCDFGMSHFHILVLFLFHHDDCDDKGAIIVFGVKSISSSTPSNSKNE